MAAATGPNQWTQCSTHLKQTNGFPVKAATSVHALSLAGMHGALGVRGFVAGTDTLLGVFEESYDNSAGALGDKTALVAKGHQVEIIVAGVDGNTVPDTDVYATDDQTFNLTVVSGNRLGQIQEVVNSSTGLCKVTVDPDN